MVVEVWEAYKRDSQSAVIARTEEEARRYGVGFFGQIDLLAKAKVELCEAEIKELDEKGYIL